ncbi:MAG: PAS domain S-box protein [Caldilineaceae bacterium]
MASAFIDLLHNIALLLAAALIFDLARLRPLNAPEGLRQLFVGFALGGIGMLIMLAPWEFWPGIFFDTRSVLLSISGLFFGVWPTVVAMLMTAGLRLSQGGAAWTGVAVIVATGALGIIWRQVRHDKLADITLRELYAFGLVVHLMMLALMFTLPWATVLSVLSHIALPVLILYPVATARLGLLMANWLRHERSERLRQESEVRYRLLADNLSDVLWILNLETGQWDYISPSVERLRGFTLEEVMKHRIEDVIPPESYTTVDALLNHRVAQAEQGVDDGRTDVNELALRHKDGSAIWTESATRLVRNEAGQLTLLGISRDISERKRIEDALRESEDKFRRLAEDAPIAIFIQIDGRFVYVNASCVALFGADSAEQLLGEELVTRYHPDFRQIVTERTRLVNQEKQTLDVMEMKILRVDGTVADIEAHAVPFVFNEKPGGLSFLQDITERKQANRTAFELALEREQTTMLTSFVREASHEFRTPLFLIQSELYLLDKVKDPSSTGTEDRRDPPTAKRTDTSVGYVGRKHTALRCR